MNRRGFLSRILKAGAAAAILPAAVTYTRRWVKPAESLIFQTYYDLDPLDVPFGISNAYIQHLSPAELSALFQESMPISVTSDLWLSPKPDSTPGLYEFLTRS